VEVATETELVVGKNGLINPQCFILDDDDGVLNLRTELGHLTDHPTRRFSAPFYSLCGVLFFVFPLITHNLLFLN
jgi:hypothetical protein